MVLSVSTTVLLCACAWVAPTRGQSTPAPGAAAGTQANVYTDAAGNLHVTSAPDQAVYINGVDMLGELAAVEAMARALSLPPPVAKVFDTANQTKIEAGDRAQTDYFGRAVGLSEDGLTLVVGAYQDDDGSTNSGSVYVFTRSAVTSTVWVQQAKLHAADAGSQDWFGRNVAISGNTIVVGAHYNDAVGFQSGAAYAFVRTGTAWAQQAKLLPGDAAANEQFGSSVAIDGDTIAIGAEQDTGAATRTGAAYAFVRTGTVWAEQAKLVASDAQASHRLGFSVAVRGNTIVAGAPPRGAAYVFTRSGSAWTQQAKLTPSDGASNDQFGEAVGIDGDTIVVGSTRHDLTSTDTGAAYVFTRAGSAWTEQDKLTASDAAGVDWFGAALAISGDSIVVGAAFNDDAGTSSGSAYVFVRTAGGAWVEQTKLTASDGATDDRFGDAVAICPLAIAVGAYADDDANAVQETGSAYVFN